MCCSNIFSQNTRGISRRKDKYDNDISLSLKKNNFIAALVGERETRFTVDDKRAKHLKAQHSARQLLKRNGRPD